MELISFETKNKLLHAIVERNNRVLNTNYSVSVIEHLQITQVVSDNYSFNGPLLKDICNLANVFGFAIGVFINKKGNPFIQL